MAEALIGRTHFHSETGTEGGYWAFQDDLFTGIPDDTEQCGICFYMRKYLEDSQQKGSVALMSSRPVGARERPACEPGQHEWVKVHPNGTWSYEGLHVLRNGDRLTIFDSDDSRKVLWEGVIRLHGYPLFTEDAFGMWIHADQEGIEREKWARLFMTEHPARLIPTE